MSYTVLARKHRPRSFEDMVGQDAAVTALGNALKQQRLHHAYLFTGTRGIGKTTVSRIFAKCLNCLGADGQGGITARPCGACDACVQIDQDRFIDYIELDAASNRGIAEIRDLLDRAAYKPSVGRFKVFMIDEAHQLTKESFNALLKTLEEPPDYVKFVLATTDPQKMPATVLSRCLQFNLRPMAPATVRDYLAKVLAQEGIPFEDAALQTLGRAAQGSMRDALSLTDQAIAFGAGAVRSDEVRTMLGSVGREPALALVAALSRRDGRAVVEQVAALRTQGLSADGTLESIASLLQDMAIEQAAPGALHDTLSDADAVRGLAQAMPADDVQLLYSIVLQGRRELPWAPDTHAGLTMCLLRLLAFPADGAPRQSQEAPTSAPVRPPSSVAPPQPSVAPPPAQSPQPASRLDPAPTTVLAQHLEPQTDALSDRWAQTVQSLVTSKRIVALVRELAMQSWLVDWAGQDNPPVWSIRVAREALAASATIDKLQSALSESLGAPQRLLVQVEAEPTEPSPDTPARREARERAQRAAAAEQVVRDDPVVQAMLSQFATARIVPGSIKTNEEFKPS